MNEHQKVIKAMKFLDKYCNERTCSSCVFSCLQTCPLYKLDEDDYKALDNKARESDNNESTEH